jgi:3-hydroxyacyl-[acyl-carrier-protein] dehydratase
MRLEKFRLVDRVIELNETAKSIRCEATVPMESSIFEGHFPGYPLMPGVLLLEAMAQTSGWMVISLQRLERMAFLAAVREAKFRNFVSPGAKLDLSAKIAHEGSGFAVTDAKAELAGKVVCDATMMFRVVDFPNTEMRDSMLEIAAEAGLPGTFTK